MIDDIQKWLDASDEEVGSACVNVPVPPTIADDIHFRILYSQGYRHAIADVRAALKSARDRGKADG